MAKQSSLFNFFTKSPPPVSKSKPKPSPSPAEADLPSSVEKSNSSPKEQAKQTGQQQPTKTNKVKPKSSSKPAKGGFNKLFGDKAPATKQRWVSSDNVGSGVNAGDTLYTVFFLLSALQGPKTMNLDAWSNKKQLFRIGRHVKTCTCFCYDFFRFHVICEVGRVFDHAWNLDFLDDLCSRADHAVATRFSLGQVRANVSNLTTWHLRLIMRCTMTVTWHSLDYIYCRAVLGDVLA